MTSGGDLGPRIAAIMALSMGPFLVMADMVAVILVKRDVILGFGPPGSVFPSYMGVTGLLLWMAGLVFLVRSKRRRKGTFGAAAHPIFLKGREGFKCLDCGRWIDASGVGYHDRITCECGKIYDLFQEGPWDRDPPKGTA